MPSKFDRLRAGDVVEIEPGRKGRLNLEDKTFETSDGRRMFVGDDADFFPQNEQALGYSREKEQLNRDVKKAPAGEFLYQFGNQGLAGSAKDWMNKIIQKGDAYEQTKRINQEVSSEISERSPWTSAGATVASFLPDLAITKGMSATKAAPLLTGLHAGPRILEEPGQVAGEAALSTAGGFLIDKGANALNRIAQRRGQVRQLPGQRQAVTESNQLGQQATNEANALQTQQFNALKQNVKSANEAKLQQHQADLNTRQNTIIQEQNAYEQRKLLRDQEVIRLKNKSEIEKAQRASSAAKSETEYRTAKEAADLENKRMAERFKQDQASYQQALKELPELQKKAQQEYSANVVKNAESIGNAFPKESRIYSSQFGVDEFIDESIRKSGMAGSKEANQASRILKSIMPDGEILTSKELASRYKALEGAIQKATPEVREVLNEFKAHVGDRLPSILADNMAYNRIVPTLRRQVEREVSSVLDAMGLAESGIASRSFLKSRAKNNINSLFREISPQDFMKKFQNGEVRQQIINSVISPNDFSQGLGALKAGRKPMTMSSAELERMGISIPPNPGQGKFEEFNQLFTNKLDKALAKAELKMIATDVDASTKLGAKVRKTYGSAEPVAPPNAPIAPEPMASPFAPAEPPPIAPVQLPPPVSPAQVPPMPGKPSLMAEPAPPTPQSFMPQPEPNLAPASGLAERTGDFLEQNLLGSGSGPLNNPLLKLGGLKYLLGKAAVPAEAAYLGMKGLTSPTAAGEAVRASFKQGGIQAVDMWARKYPSYQNGILQSPQDRRSFTKEIEDDFEIPLEQKAVIQSKINRGMPLQQRL